MEQGEDLDALFGNVTRYRPKELRELTTITKFSRKEIQHIYRGFKQECPLGTVDEDGFKQLFSQFFPFGDAAKYAQLVFATMKTTDGDIVTFEEFLSSLSAVARGSMEDKIAWIFSLYDTNRDGFITRDEMHEVVESIYEMLGANTIPAMEPDVIDQHVDDVFSKMDSDGDGVITIDDMGRWCTREAELQGSLDVFNTVW